MTRHKFRIANMSADVRAVTAILILLPIGMTVSAFFGGTRMLVPAAILTLLYILVWAFYRPSAFAVTEQSIEVIWPLRRREIKRASILSARIVESRALQQDLGWFARIGAGGLWGGFGWLWTQKRGIAQMYVSRRNELVWLERGRDRPWLISPENPRQFLEALFPVSR